jgi:hypothetical protein
MRLAFKFLGNVCNVNNYKELESVAFVQGNPSTLYFQLVDQDAGDKPIRYIPASGSSVAVHFDHIDLSKVIDRPASQPFPLDDRSIWQVSIMATDTLASNGMTATLTQGANSYLMKALGDLRMDTISGSGKYYC